MTEAEFLRCVHRNPINSDLLRRLRALALPDCYLTAGCLFQTVWNQVAGQPPQRGIKDYDVFYFDPSDPSWDAEDRVIRRVAGATADLPVDVEVRNQARVHLWYAERFGSDYPRLLGTRDGINRYLIACTCVGIEVQTGGLYAPNGLAELADGELRLNPLTPTPARFRDKAESYRARWPWLRIIDPAGPG